MYGEDSEEGEESSTNSGEGERTARDENGGARDRRKRALEEDEAMDNTPLQEHSNKRSKTDRGDYEDDAVKNDSLSRTNGLETQTRPRTPSRKSTTPSSLKRSKLSVRSVWCLGWKALKVQSRMPPGETPSSIHLVEQIRKKWSVQHCLLLVRKISKGFSALCATRAKT